MEYKFTVKSKTNDYETDYIIFWNPNTEINCIFYSSAKLCYFKKLILWNYALFLVNYVLSGNVLIGVSHGGGYYGIVCVNVSCGGCFIVSVVSMEM